MTTTPTVTSARRAASGRPTHVTGIRVLASPSANIAQVATTITSNGITYAMPTHCAGCGGPFREDVECQGCTVRRNAYYENRGYSYEDVCAWTEGDWDDEEERGER